jgi:HEAT repeat protein
VHGAAPVSGGDEPYLGATRRPIAVGPPRLDDKIAMDVIVPALHAALCDTNDPNVVTACLIGLAKIGRDTKTIVLRDVFVRYLPARFQETRETAALALGICRQPGSLPILRDLLLDTAAGRRLTQRAEVDRRVRAFAAYGIGILAAHGDADTRTRAFDMLHSVSRDPAIRDREVQVATISAMGVLAPRPDDNAKDKRLLWRALPALDQFYRADHGKARQLVQAHVGIAIARLLGRGTGVDHARFVELFGGELFAGRRRQQAIQQSAAIALGLLATPDQKAISDRLFRYYEIGRDQQTRYFSLISLGEIGGATNRTRLLRIVSSGNKATERPWAALGLGVLAHKLRTANDGTVDKTIGDALLRQLTTVKNKEAVGAFAIALGLCGYRDAGARMRRFLLEHPHHDGVAGALCTGLALMDDQAAVAEIRWMLHRSLRRPELLRQAAVALGKLRDQEAVRYLLEMLAESGKNTARMAALAGALQFIGDRRTVDALVRQLGDRDLTSLSRAFVAAALGGIGDPMALPFNARYAGHSNYRAVVETLSNQATGILDLL